MKWTRSTWECSGPCAGRPDGADSKANSFRLPPAGRELVELVELLAQADDDHDAPGLHDRIALRVEHDLPVGPAQRQHHHPDLLAEVNVSKSLAAQRALRLDHDLL